MTIADSESLADECRAIIKRIDDLLHDDDSEAAHVDLHELAHLFEQCIAAQRLADCTDLEISDEWERRFGIHLEHEKCVPAQRPDLTSCSNLEIAYEWERRFGPLAEPRLAQTPDHNELEEWKRANPPTEALKELMQHTWQADAAQSTALPASEALARVLAESQGHDPDALAPRTEMCTADDEQVPWWQVFEEQADAVHAFLNRNAQRPAGCFNSGSGKSCP
jgi:hypothetical protein